MPSVLDAAAMMALILDEPGAEIVLAALTRPGNACLAHEVNLCEVFYTRTRQADEETAQAELDYLLGDAGVLPQTEQKGQWRHGSGSHPSN
jgi:uncharacterized protein with PIN domain